MFISKSEYNKLIEENTVLKRKVREQGVRISDLLLKIDELNLKLYADKDKCYEVELILQNGRVIQYTICAETGKEACDIAGDDFEKNNLNFSKKDIRIAFYKEI